VGAAHRCRVCCAEVSKGKDKGKGEGGMEGQRKGSASTVPLRREQLRSARMRGMAARGAGRPAASSVLCGLLLLAVVWETFGSGLAGCAGDPATVLARGRAGVLAEVQFGALEYGPQPSECDRRQRRLSAPCGNLRQLRSAHQRRKRARK